MATELKSSLESFGVTVNDFWLAVSKSTGMSKRSAEMWTRRDKGRRFPPLPVFAIIDKIIQAHVEGGETPVIDLDFQNRFSTYLKSTLKREEIKAIDFCREFEKSHGIHRTSVQNWIHKKRIPHAKDFIKIAPMISDMAKRQLEPGEVYFNQNYVLSGNYLTPLEKVQQQKINKLEQENIKLKNELSMLKNQPQSNA